MKPQEPIPHNYAMSRLNAIFAFSAIVLLMTTGLLVFYDYVRGWKWFQADFMRLQADRIRQDLKAADDAQTRQRLADLDKRMRDQQVVIARHRDEYVAAQKDLDDWEGKHYAADQDYRFAKAVLDARRYELEMAVLQRRPDRAEQRREYDKLAQHVNDLNLRLQQATRDRDAAKARLDVWLKRIDDVEAEKKEITANVELLDKQLTNVAPNERTILLNAPMLDFINPTFKVDQVVLADLFIDMNYMSVPRVDRCQTCHRAIDRPGFESKKEAARLETELRTKLDKNLIEPRRRQETEDRIAQLQRIQNSPTDILNPFRTHPRLDTFVGSSSPHPLLEYGCTACHRGQDRATEFGRAGHTPASRKMEKRWESAVLPFFAGPWDYSKREWGYASNPFLETPMYPRQHYEAGCIKCHSGQMEVDKGDRITQAEHMVELYGCHACHKINTWRFTDLQKPGPTLDHIAEKVTPDWAFRWISNPRGFKSTTRMPAFFYQRNMIGPAVPADERAQNIRFQDAEIHAIVTYLFSHSTQRRWEGPNTGDPARGKTIVENVGCLACHLNTETFTDADGKTRMAHRDDYPLERNFGFNLANVGTKTYPGWIYNWIKNPHNYDPNAPMPSLRLTDAEAADVTAYLMTLQKPRFMQTPVRPADPKAVHDLAKSYLINTMTDRDAEARLKSMGLNEQLDYLGQRSIEKYGCYSCHEIKGFEGLKPIGTELTTEGSKTLHLFDFGFVHEYQNEDGKEEKVIHTVPSWVYNKLRSPRVYDDERAKTYNDKLKMPNFGLTPREAELISSVVLGLTKERVAANRLAATDARSRLMEEGRKLVSQRNCRGCHVVDGHGRAIAALIKDSNFLPPDLSPQGGRAQSPWLFDFLKDPTVMKIRPWLSVRMPTFQFTDDEANRLVSMFAAEGKVPQFDTYQHFMPPAPNIAIGREVFSMLRCAQCHQTVPVGDPANPPIPNTADTTSLAPNLTLAKVRLRHDWIADWIRRPDEMIPGTRMPTNFPRDGATGGFQSPLAMAIDTPQFAAHKAVLLPYFKSEDDLRAAMKDAVALTGYLRDYIWSIGINGMRAPQPLNAPPAMTLPQQPRTPPPTPVQTGELPGRGPRAAGLRPTHPGGRDSRPEARGPRPGLGDLNR
ncbi:MAG TPA: c-type cytochrome [Thermoanaerobaculia bacterium]|nr:c-type cytochrome [Thermoanaerobaculia bacterium]